jgi:hypothetical protein
MKWLKQMAFPLVCCAFLIYLVSKSAFISTKLATVIENNPTYSDHEKSDYYKKDSFIFVENTDSFVPFSKGDLKNIFFTVVNSGWNNFTFYCPSEYPSCVQDMKDFSQDQNMLTHINNFVHPYNSFSNIKTTLSESGEITLQVEYLYTEEQVKKIEQKMTEIIMQEINPQDSLYDQIKAMHDYLINTTKYDVTRNENGDSKYLSYLAYGPLFEGYATCNGYTDAMAIFLGRLQLSNFKIATTPEDLQEQNEGHVWNAVYLDHEWLHLDLTWDDPVSKDGKDYLQHKYFLVNNEELNEADQGTIEVLEHQFKKNVYLEFKD